MGVAMAAIRTREKRRTQQFLSRTSSQLDISSQSSYRSARCNYYKYKKVQAELLRLATFVVTNNAAVLRCIGRSPANQIIYRLTSAAKTFSCTIGPMLAKVVTKTLFFANSLSHLPLRNTFYIALGRNIRDVRNISSFLAGKANKHDVVRTQVGNSLVCTGSYCPCSFLQDDIARLLRQWHGWKITVLRKTVASMRGTDLSSLYYCGASNYIVRRCTRY